jgi:uncharacterized protein YjbI with pentapeptide repeats
MANSQHVKVLRLGSREWNRWRRNNQSVRPILSGADLKRADLLDADLSDANLFEANLSGAKLRRVNLSGANLNGAVFGGADLREANLTRTDLGWANLTDANLSNTNLSGAKIYRTVFGNTNLTNALGQDFCLHLGPSIVDHSTLTNSGLLSLQFLRGCGLPDNFITYLPSFLNQPFEFFSCFISYSTGDQEFADRLYADLQNKGVRCWFAPHDIQGGKKIHEQIDEAIRVYERLLLILSPASMSSEWVRTEISKARKRERQENRRMLFPARLVSYEALQAWECFDSAREIREYYVPDFSNWKHHDSYKREFEKLLRDLRIDQAGHR